MIRTSRRSALLGALAVPALAGIAHWSGASNGTLAGKPVLVHDPALEAGRHFAKAGAAQGARVQPIHGDRIRFTRDIAAKNPSLIAGVSRYADFLLIADVLSEAGYSAAAVLHSHAGLCHASQCQKGWSRLSQVGKAVGKNWPETLAYFITKPENSSRKIPIRNIETTPDRGLILGWVLARKIS